ncbi:DUF7260 family protein [Halobellus sp. EA9]|uniref:DUF7260 family protein n=1 Tax=Halobellus sp. EA9 TaxID=3421647 RepID=UPI003EB8A79D
MAASGEFGTELDAYREQVERPLWRLFGAYTPDHALWLTIGLVTSVLAYGTVHRDAHRARDDHRRGVHPGERVRAANRPRRVVAVALAPTTEASFTPELKQMVLAEAQSRRAEATALQNALEREETHLGEASDAVHDIIAWIVNANETPLTDLGFDALQQRHETLVSHRASCEDVARDRQEFLKEATNNGVDAGVRHRSLIPYQYQDFPVDHPVLATVATLDETCEECQRTVRDHLGRRA